MMQQHKRLENELLLFCVFRIGPIQIKPVKPAELMARQIELAMESVRWPVQYQTGQTSRVRTYSAGLLQDPPSGILS